jgi:hypothetical protein
MALTFDRFSNWHKTFVVVALVLSMFAGMMAPARADSAATTRNIILGAVAVAAGIILYNNYQHKLAAANTAAQQANTVVGYTNDGGVIYGNGRVVYPNSGNVVTYLSNNGSQPCTFNGSGPRCQTTHMVSYFPHGYQPACWPPGHCKQYWKQNKSKEDNDNEGHGNQGNSNQGNGNQGNGNQGHGNQGNGNQGHGN